MGLWSPGRGLWRFAAGLRPGRTGEAPVPTRVCLASTVDLRDGGYGTFWAYYQDPAFGVGA